MGFSIDICSIGSSGEYRERYDCTYLSYNWSRFSEICLAHCLERNCPSELCTRTHLWCFYDDCHRRCGSDVASRAQNALDLLRTAGIIPGTPDIHNSQWGYGTDTVNTGYTMVTVNLPHTEQLSIFAYHINRFKELGEKYPNYFFFGDMMSDMSPIIPKGFAFIEDHQPVLPVVTYFKHPFKGDMAIRTFKDAMEVYGLVKAQNGRFADGWYDLAFTMPDAPKFN